MWGYRTRLSKDLPRWREAGWVTAEGETAILDEVAESGSGLRAASVLGILGVVLLGFAVMSFVAANWQDMPRIARLGLLLSLLFASYLAAAALFARGLDVFAHAMVLLGACIFGASIMLIAQMYHIDGNPPDTALIWAIGALLAGLAFGSNPTIALSLLLVALWSGWEVVQTQEVHWPFLFAWAVVTAIIAWRSWRPGLHLAAVLMSVWIISLGYLLKGADSHLTVVMAGLLTAAAAGVSQIFVPKLDHIARPTLCYAIAVAFAGLFALQMRSQLVTSFGLAPLAITTLALLVAAIAWGLKTKKQRTFMDRLCLFFD